MQVVVTWVLGTKLGSSGKVGIAFDYWAISVPHLTVWPSWLRAESVMAHRPLGESREKLTHA